MIRPTEVLFAFLFIVIMAACLWIMVP